MTTDKDLIEMIFMIVFGFAILILSECIALSRYGTISAFIDKNEELLLGLGAISLFTVVPFVIGIVAVVIDAYKRRKTIDAYKRRK